MSDLRVKAFAAGLAADAIRTAIPSKNTLVEAELLRPEDYAAVYRELERLANNLQARALQFENL